MELVIAQMKNACRLGLNWPQQKEVNAFHARLHGRGYNLRMNLRKRRLPLGLLKTLPSRTKLASFWQQQFWSAEPLAI